MNKAILIALVMFVLAAAGLGVLVANSTYTYQAKDGSTLVKTAEGALLPERIADLKKKSAVSTRRVLPKAAIDQNEHDFGMMDPLTMGSHIFVIRNEGEGDLELTKGSTTCKCTLSKLSDGIVPPGGEAEVELTWNTGRNQYYAHGAEIITNDPFKRKIKLNVRGTVRTLLGATRKELVFAQLNPDESATLETVVFSQSMDDFTIDKVTSTIDGLTWEIEPAKPELIEEIEALNAYVVRVTTPADLKSGAFSGVLRLAVEKPEPESRKGEKAEHEGDAAPRDDAEQETTDGKQETSEAEQETADLEQETASDAKPLATDPDASDHEGHNHGESNIETLELTVAGKVLSRLSVYGKAIETTGNINLGLIPVGQGRKTRLLMKVRDAQYEIPVKSLDVKPQFVKVEVTDGGKSGLYYLDIEVPADAPKCQHNRGDRRGRLQFTFNHPRIERLDLSLSFAVVPSGL